MLKLKMSYRFDNMMSRGLIALIGLLALASLIFIALVSAVVVIFRLYPPQGDIGFLEVFWGSLLRTLDPGTMGADAGPGFRASMLVVTLSGVILVASLIGIISNAFNSKIELLRKGRSRVLETDHTLILGWNSKVFPIISEVCVANLSRKKGTIVILANRDKVAMEDEIHGKLKNIGKTKIIVRSGDPMSLNDIQIVNPASARSIVILSDDDSEDADSISIKTCLAVLNGKTQGTAGYHIVGEIKDIVNLEAARLVGGSQAKWILGEDLISRLIVQTCRQSGLSSVFTELLDFEGDELYLTQQADFVGKTYGEILLRFSMGAALGLMRGDAVYLNPDQSTIIEETDQIIVIAEDDSSIQASDDAAIDLDAFAPIVRARHDPESTLVLGYNRSLPKILTEMSTYMPKGSSVVVVSDGDGIVLPDLQDLNVRVVVADPTSRHALVDLGIESFDHIVVLANRQKYTVQKGDARTLMTLLQLRRIAEEKGATLNIVSEMLDDQNRELAQTTDADDFIVSDKLVSLMIAQIEENRQLTLVFDSLLSSEGSEIRLHPVEWYVKTGLPVDFNTIVAAAASHGDSALGYNLVENRISDARLHGVRLNPARDEKVIFHPGDKLVVLTDD